MENSDEFQGVLSRLRAGKNDAAEQIFARYVRRLTALASRQFDSGIRHRADPEGVVQSVYRSFFSRDVRAHYRLEDWESLWKLLAVITVRKCTKRRQKYRKEQTVTLGWPVAESETDAAWIEAIDRAPTPAEAAALTETVSQLFRELDSDDREMAERILQGFTAVEIGLEFKCSERTVRRLRDLLRERLERLNSEDSRS
jgi:RNA polymerase sigma factor (sigma-70 family)